MKAALPLLVLCVAWQHAHGKAADTTARRDDAGKTDKRALVEGNSGLNKRAPLLGSPGIEYADTTESLPDKSPPQQVYATPVPQLRKISDVLSGQGPSYPTAIANHLYSPLQVYQPLGKVESPTYEVSAPVPSQLAYSEHKIFYPGLSAPQPSGIQYYNVPQKIFSQPAPTFPQQTPNFARATALSYAPPQHQVSFIQQPLFHQHQYSPVPQQFIAYPQTQPGYVQQQYQQYARNEQSSPSNTRPQTFAQSQPDQNSGVTYAQPFIAQNPVAFVQNVAPNSLQFATSHTSYTAPGVVQKPIQRDLNSQPINVIDKNSDVDNQAIKNEVKSQIKGGAVSYASFSQSESANRAPTLQNAYLPSAALVPKAPQAGPNYIPSVAKVPTAPAYVPIGQPIGQPVAGYYPQPSFYHTAPQQVFVHGPTYQLPQVGYAQHNLAAVAPTFPAVQYFGKFAHNLLGGYAH